MTHIPDRLGAVPVVRDGETLDRYRQNVSALTRQLRGVVYPRSTQEVQALVLEAIRAKVALHPISTGANWGLGSRLPVTDGCVVVDLSGMKRIHEVNERMGYAVLEPGVTQRALHEQLRSTGSAYFLNVTGSSAQTSVVGNALDRGIAHYGPRADELLGLEVVLGTGEVVRTGSAGRDTCQTAYLYRHGVGPSLDGLFFQSRFGVVTRAGLRLRRRPPVQGVLRCGLDFEWRLPELVERARRLVQEGVLPPSVHFPNRDRSRSVLGSVLARTHPAARVERLLEAAQLPAWSMSCPVGGTQRQVDAALEAVREALEDLGPVRWSAPGAAPPPDASEDARALFEAGQGSYEHALGVPSEVAVGSISWPLGDDSYAPGMNLDQTGSGTVFVVPVLPMGGDEVAEVVALTQELAARHHFVPYVTFNAASETSLEGVINFLFHRADVARARAAHACADALTESLSQRGYILCRAGIQAMRHVVDPRATYWQITARLEQTLDPAGILSPGRYSAW